MNYLQFAPITNKSFFISYTYMTTNSFSKTMGEQTGSAKTHLDAVVDLADSTTKIHEIFANDLSNLMTEVALLKQKVKKNPHELRRYMVETLQPVQQQFMAGEQYQKYENKAAQQIMTQVKRQNKQTAESIAKTFEKLKHLEIKVGKY